MIRHILSSNRVSKLFNEKTKNVIFQRYTTNDVSLFKKLGKSNYDLTDDFNENYVEEKVHTKQLTTRTLINKLKNLLDLKDGSLEIAVLSEKRLKIKSLTHITKMITYLMNEKITNVSIVNNIYLLVSSLEIIKLKLELIRKMDPKDINDIVPLMKISTLKLNKIVKIATKEFGYINRIYYFSEKLKVNPEEVSRYFSTHLFMFEISYENFIEKLEVFMNYNVASINILRDLWAFKYTPESIKKRLDRAKVAQKDKIMPWMVRCTEPILVKSLQLTTECKAVLGENESALDYLSRRLNYDLVTTNFIVGKHPAVLKVRVTKIKDILDFLLEEAGFTNHHVAMVPRVLCHSLETTKTRLKELEYHGCIPNSLIVVCKSRREYSKFLENWIEVGNRIRKQKINNGD